jgi:hypothetical protein
MERGYELADSSKLLNELDGVLLRARFRSYLSEEEAGDYVRLFRRFTVLVKDFLKASAPTPDPGDDYRNHAVIPQFRPRICTNPWICHQTRENKD